VLVNGSRAHLPQAKARYEAALLPICLQVSPDVLRSCKPGRENAREIDQRLERARRATPSGCHVLNNDGSLLQSVEIFLSLIRQKEKQHA
jgi:ribose 1,5-bisphosphokinase